MASLAVTFIFRSNQGEFRASFDTVDKGITHAALPIRTVGNVHFLNHFKGICKPKFVGTLSLCHVDDPGGSQAHVFPPVNGLIVNISHCTYKWSSMSYSYVYGIRSSVKLTLVTSKN